MDARTLSVITDVDIFSTLKGVNVTVSSKPDLALRGFEADRTSDTVVWIPLRDGRKAERWRLYPLIATMPSEASTFPTALDATEDSENVMAVLEIAAEAGNEATFVRVTSGIDWMQRPANDFVRAVRLALAAGAHLLARNLASQGARLYPDHSELRKMAHILDPARVVNANIPPTPSVRANRVWLRDHAYEYKGQWVALQEGTLLATGATARGVWDRLESTDGVMLTKVF
ncbi:MAG: hypothetical protein ISS50_09435 [Anaerolineae bacterium]|nr:hypothetical protein [Anaerolineae bacterium]